MLLLSMLLETNKRTYKAPSMKMFLIKTIAFSSTSTTNMYVLVFDEKLGFLVTTDTDRRSALAAYNLGSNRNYVVPDVDHKCKNITITKSQSGTVDAMVHIYGDLVTVSKKELIIEWFRKG